MARISHVRTAFSSLILHSMLLASLINKLRFPPPPWSKDCSLKILLSNRAELETYSSRQIIRPQMFILPLVLRSDKMQDDNAGKGRAQFFTQA